MPKRKWQDEFYVESYRLARCGLSNNAIAGSLGVGAMIYQLWVREKPALAAALDLGRRPEKGGVARFRDHIKSKFAEACEPLYKRLTSPDLRERIVARNELQEGGKPARQRMFLYALLECNYAESKAMAVACVTPKELALWKTGPKFMGMLNETERAKKDFFESAYIELVERGDPAAIIHAAKTVNRDRGYGDHVVVERVGGREKAPAAKLSRLTPEELKTLQRLVAKMNGRAAGLLEAKDAVKVEVEAVEVDAVEA